MSYLEPSQIGTDIGPHLVPLDDVAAAGGVTAHGAGAGALVEALVDVLGCEAELAVAHAQEGAGGLHFGGWVRFTAWIGGDVVVVVVVVGVGVGVGQLSGK